MEVLGQLLAAHTVLQLLPDARRAAEFSAHVLISVPAVLATAAFIDGEQSVEGEWGDLQPLLDQQTDDEPPHVTWQWTPSGLHLLRLTLGTINRRQGQLCLLTDDPTAVEPYVPFLGNMAAAIALTLENRRSRLELEAANARLAESRAEYEQLFRTMSSGFAVHEIITDHEGEPIDYRFLEVNEAFERLTGLRREDVIGRRAREVMPGLEPEWVKTYGRVALEGEEVRFESYAGPLDRHYEVVAYRPAPGRFAAVFIDVTDRRQAEVERQRLVDELSRIASTLQENLIHPLPNIAGLELGRVSSTAHLPDLVGGDFSDVFVIDQRRVAILIGDVAGKGIRAAGLTETVHTAVASYALIDDSPAFILRKTNELLLRRAESEDQFVTAFLLVVDLGSGAATYASAGHPPPVLIRGREVSLLDISPALPLGLFDGHYAVSHLSLAPGDCLVLYTDGVTEARRGGELLGDQRLLARVRRLRTRDPQVLTEGLRAAALEFATELKDDLQILALRLS